MATPRVEGAAQEDERVVDDGDRGVLIARLVIAPAVEPVGQSA